jgi:hypothetical protein
MADKVDTYKIANGFTVNVHLSDFQIDIDPARHPPDKVYTPWKGEFPVITWEFAPFGRKEWKYLVRRLDGRMFSRKVQHNIARREARARRRMEAKRG